MTNNEIIINQAIAHGIYTKAEAQAIVAAKGCLPMQQAPTGCDYAADLAYYGKHYFLRPLRDGLPPLHGRGITYDAEQGTYMVTLRAYDKIKAQYKIKRETCLD